jgi:hypothetical protein
MSVPSGWRPKTKAELLTAIDKARKDIIHVENEKTKVDVDFHVVKKDRMKHLAQLQQLLSLFPEVLTPEDEERISKIGRLKRRLSEVRCDCFSLEGAIKTVEGKDETQRKRYQAQLDELGDEEARILEELKGLGQNG